MPAGTRRAVRWLAAAAAVAITGGIAAVIALRGGAALEAWVPGRPSPGAPDAGDPGIAVPVTTPEVAEAMQLVASAKAEAASGNLAQARALLAQAYAADPTFSTLLELATVEFQTGHCRDARRDARRVAATGGPLADRARDLLGQIGRCD